MSRQNIRIVTIFLTSFAILGLLAGPAAADRSGTEGNPFDDIREQAKPKEPAVPPPPPFAVPAGVETAPIRLHSAQTRLRTGDVIGGFQGNPFFGMCAYSDSKLVWPGGRWFPSQQDLDDIFGGELRAMGYRPVTIGYGFTEGEAQVDYFVSATLTKLELDICRTVSFWTGMTTGENSGTSTLEIEWEVLDALTRKVVYRKKTRGSGVLEEPSTEAASILIQRGFASAAQHLAASDDFLTLVRLDAPPRQTRQVAHARVDIAGASPFRRDAPDRFSYVQNATVAILHGASGHGSGFFISQDGYLLTNQHVVGGQQQVRVRMLNGIEVVGEVLARDEPRDVALVKVEVINAPALPVDPRLPEVGSDIYAVGAPLLEELQGTVSRGIVSAHRPATGREPAYIQGDVDIHGGNSGGPLTDSLGNVVGITVAGIGMMGSQQSVGLNLFIPIAEALAVLNVQLDADS